MKKLGKDCKNITWQTNQALIQNAYIKLIRELKRCPTLHEISQEVNLSITTLEKHVQELKFEPLKNLMRTLTPDIVMSIANSARKGSSASQKLWMQIMEGWTERHEITGKDGKDLIQQMPDNELLTRIDKLAKPDEKD